MDPIQKNQESVFFAWELTNEEEYKIMTAPVQIPDTSNIKKEGNYLVPTKKGYLKETPEIPSFLVKEDDRIYVGLLFSLLNCEPFYNLVLTFKDRAKNIKDLTFFNNIYDLSAVIRNEPSLIDCYERPKSLLNKILKYVKETIKGSTELEICKKMIFVLHEEFTKKHVFEQTGWKNPKDDLCKKNCEFLKKFSPIKELFTGTIKRKLESETIIEFFDVIEVENDVEQCMDEFLQREKYANDSETWFSSLPVILIFIGESINGKEELKVKDQEYVLKSVIDQNTLYHTNAKDCKFMIYRKKSIEVF